MPPMMPWLSILSQLQQPETSSSDMDAVVRALRGGNAPVSAANNFMQALQAQMPAPMSEAERQGAQRAVTNADMINVMNVLGRQPATQTSSELMFKQAMLPRQIAEQRSDVERFNIGQENQFGRVALQNQAALERLRIQEAGKFARVSGKPGKVRVLQEADEAGNPINVAYQEVTDESGSVSLKRIGLAGQESTQRPIHFQSVPTEGGGVTRVPTTGSSAAGQTVSGPGGTPLMRQPPGELVGKVANDVTTLKGLDVIWKGYQKLHTSTGGDQPLFSLSTVKRVLGTELGETKYGGKISPEYNIYLNERRAALNRYVKSITGAQFSVKELERYEAQFPQITDDEATAKQKLEILAQQSAADMMAYISAHGGLARMRQDPTESWRFGPEGATAERPTPPSGRSPEAMHDHETPQQKLERLRKKHNL